MRNSKCIKNSGFITLFLFLFLRLFVKVIFCNFFAPRIASNTYLCSLGTALLLICANTTVQADQ